MTCSIYKTRQWVRSLLGGFGGRKFYIRRGTIYSIPIWDVFVPEGEWEEAGEHIYGAKFVELSKLGKQCQACSGSVLLLGSLWLLFQG